MPSPSPRPEGPALRNAIGTRHAVALYGSSVLGSGILVPAGLAAEIAGPGSLLAWAPCWRRSPTTVSRVRGPNARIRPD